MRPIETAEEFARRLTPVVRDNLEAMEAGCEAHAAAEGPPSLTDDIVRMARVHVDRGHPQAAYVLMVLNTAMSHRHGYTLAALAASFCDRMAPFDPHGCFRRLCPEGLIPPDVEDE